MTSLKDSGAKAATLRRPKKQNKTKNKTPREKDPLEREKQVQLDATTRGKVAGSLRCLKLEKRLE